MAGKTKVDPITVSMLDNHYSAITEEMAKVLVRTSRSPIFAEAHDFGIAIFDRDVRQLAQKDWIPGNVCFLPVVVQNMVKAWEGDINEGDIFISNDAYNGNMHLPDVSLLKPVFYKGDLLFWVSMVGHMVDIGGRARVGYDPSARSVHEEGLIIPCCKLYDSGKLNRSVWDLIIRNIKLPELFDGDLRGMVGTLITGERRLLRLLEGYEPEIQYAAIDEIIAATGKETRDKIRQIPDGVYYGEKSGDHDGIVRDRPVTVRVKVIKQGDEVAIDLSDSDDQSRGYVNCSWGNTFSACHLAIFYALPGAAVKRNQGSIEPIKVIARKGCCVNPEYPAPLQMNYFMTPLIIEAICLALAPAIPQWIAAGHGIANGDAITGFDSRRKKPFSYINFFSAPCGSGGTEGYDGWDRAGPAFVMGQMHTPDLEILELALPLHILQYEQVGGREGIGKFRGGHGTAFKCQYLADTQAVMFGAGMRDFATPSGLFGGRNAKKIEAYLYRADGRVEKLDVATFFDTKVGDTYQTLSQGGAGFGPPLERDPERVQQDVRDEWLSIEQAKEEYGVVINLETLQVDQVATEKLRAKWGQSPVKQPK